MRGIMLLAVFSMGMLIMSASYAAEQNYATLTWKSKKLMNWLEETWGLAVYDVNGDGVKDIIATVNGNNVSVFDGVTHKEIERFLVVNISLISFLFNYEYVAQTDNDAHKELVLGALGLLGGNIFVVDLETHKLKSKFSTLDQCMVVGDVDGDGIDEIVTGGDKISIYKAGNSVPIKESDKIYGNAVDMKIASINGKKVLIAVAVKIGGSILNPTYTSRIYEFSLPDLTMSLNVSAGEKDAHVIEVADINGDGKSEVLVGGDLNGLTSGGYIQVYSQSGTLISETENFSSSVANIKVADLRGDGNVEIVIATDSIGILYPSNFTYIWSSDTLYDVGEKCGMVIADLAGNGTTKIIVWAYAYSEGGRIYEYTINKPLKTQAPTPRGTQSIFEKYLPYIVGGIAGAVIAAVVAIIVVKRRKARSSNKIEQR